jgi:hypothetical protein
MLAKWLVIGLRRGARICTESASADSAVSVATAVGNKDVDAVAVISPETSNVVNRPVEELFSDIDFGQPAVVLILAWRPPPLEGLRYDVDDVRSICVSVNLLKDALIATGPSTASVEDVAFYIVDQITSNKMRASTIAVRQAGAQTAYNEPDRVRLYDLIMAHRGHLGHLQGALHCIASMGRAPTRTMVGLDVNTVAVYDDLVDAYSEVEFYSVSPVPAGPYVVRSALIERSSNPFIMFHDSDDISCFDRATRLFRGFENPSVGLVGSHEIRLDETAHRLIAVRYPLDVSLALTLQKAFPILPPSTAVSRPVFEQAGGLSTHSIFGNDAQFLMRAYFYTFIRNVDEFLYIRRKHANALTVRPDTGLGSTARHRFEAPFAIDFRKIQRNEKTLADSALRRINGTAMHAITRLSPEARMGYNREG